MDIKSTSNRSFISALETAARQGEITKKLKGVLLDLYLAFHRELTANGIQSGREEENFLTFLYLIKERILKPFSFKPYHKCIRSPFDYYQFGIELFRPLVDKERSSVLGREHLEQILKELKKGDNVILFANHQTEADPQAISLLLEQLAPGLAEEMIFVAGERVITDPLAIPLSMGRNLLCIYSKRYIDTPPEKRLKKLEHNKRTMDLMRKLLQEGGKCIYVAPSGGRDRLNTKGEVEIAAFDEKSIEMFYLMAKRARTTTHFHPLALFTYHLLPPPQTIQVELGESRTATRGGIHLAFGKEIPMDQLPLLSDLTKRELRKARAHYIWNLVKQDYLRLCKATTHD